MMTRLNSLKQLNQIIIQSIMDINNCEYSWLCKSINDINRSYFAIKLRNEPIINSTNVLELLDAQHYLIQVRLGL